MTQPQKTGTPAAGKFALEPATAAQKAIAAASDLTFAAFTPSELRALQVICRDADNDTFAKKLLGDAIARAEAAK